MDVGLPSLQLSEVPVTIDVRNGVTRKVHIGRLVGYVTVNEWPEESAFAGMPREVFVHGFGGFGSTLQGLMDTFGILLSLSLQRGVELRTLAHKLARYHMDPHGETDDPEIPWAWSIPDYVITLLVYRYGDDKLIADVIEERKRDAA